MARNQLRPHEFEAMFHRAKPGIAGAGCSEFDYEALSPWVGHTPDSIRNSLSARWEVDTRRSTQPSARYCPECAIHGYHSVFHNVAWIRNCVIHGVPLVNRCPTCRRRIVETEPDTWGASPTRLPCGHEWTPTNLRGPVSLDLRGMRLLAEWVLRVRSWSSGERWYALSLGSRNGLDAFHEEYSAIGDLVTALGPLPQEIRHAVGTRWPDGQMQMLAATTLPADWFNESIRRFKFSAGEHLVNGEERKFWSIRQKLLNDSLRKVSEPGFKRGVREALVVLDMPTRSHVAPCWPDSVIDVVSAVFLKRLSTWWVQGRYGTDDFSALARFGMRFAAQPLGLLRRTQRNDEVYWLPMAT